MTYGRAAHRRLDDFRTLARMGQDATTVVHRARDRISGELVAVRRWREPFPAETRVAFVEACAARALGHPRVAGVRWADAPVDAPAWLVAGLYERSLADRLGDEEPLTRIEAARIADDLVAGLAAIHATGRLHLNVGPTTVLLHGGRAAVFDLDLPVPGGAAPAVEDRFHAPETRRGASDARSDVHSAAETIRALWPVPVPWQLATVLAAATSWERAPRPADAADLRRALRTALDLDGTPARNRRWRRRPA